MNFCPNEMIEECLAISGICQGSSGYSIRIMVKEGTLHLRFFIWCVKAGFSLTIHGGIGGILFSKWKRGDEGGKIFTKDVHFVINMSFLWAHLQPTQYLPHFLPSTETNSRIISILCHLVCPSEWAVSLHCLTDWIHFEGPTICQPSNCVSKATILNNAVTSDKLLWHYLSRLDGIKRVKLHKLFHDNGNHSNS